MGPQPTDRKAAESSDRSIGATPDGGVPSNVSRLDDALDRMSALHRPVTGDDLCPLGDAAGRILSRDLTAPFDVPPMAVSAMDGFGFVHPGASSDPKTFRLVGRVPAGTVFGRRVEPGEAVSIFTGAPIPIGVDTVAPREDCRWDDASVTVNDMPRPGAHVRPAGEDMAAGAVVLRAGTRLRPQEVGLAAALGVDPVPVRGRLRVTLFSTGDELREPGAHRPPGTIYDANRHTIGAQLAALGVELTDLGILPDRPQAIRAALIAAAAESDLLVTSGGVSIGEEDHVKAVVTELGAIDMWRLAVRPGKPLALGRIGKAVFLGLPGNPVSAMVTFMLVGRPLVLRLSGADRWRPITTQVVAGFDFAKKAGRREFLRVRLDADPDGRPVARKFPNDSSGVLTSMVEADGLVDVHEETTSVRPGDMVRFLPFGGLGM